MTTDSKPENWLNELLAWLRKPTSASQPATGETELAHLLAPIDDATALDLESLLGIIENQLETLTDDKKLSLFAQSFSSRIKSLVSEQSETEFGELQPQVSTDVLQRIYERLSESQQDTCAAHILHILASQQDDESLEVIAEILSNSPPEQWQSVGIALSPLWQADGSAVASFFDHLGDGFVHPNTMSVLLDLANYSVRNAKLSGHPWAARAEQLSELLKNVVVRLEKLQKSPSEFGDSVDAIQQSLSDSVALTVSLCDALGQISDSVSEPALIEAMQLSHRHIQTEASAALVRLGNDQGRERLLALTTDSAARMRAVAYASELGMSDDIDPKNQSASALAESELASWLSAPEQFGIPPTSIELLDERTQHWPSYEEPQQCFLFRYSYALPSGAVSNIGITGPLTQAFQADLANLPVEDIYAVFAGWQAEHEDIFELPMNGLNEVQRREVDRLAKYFEDREFEVLENVALTLFFGDTSLLSFVQQNDKKLIAMTDGNELVCFPVSEHPASFTPETILCMYRGRKLLRTFNA